MNTIEINTYRGTETFVEGTEVKLNDKDNVLTSAVFAGQFEQEDNKGKRIAFSISNHLVEGKTYKFRYVSKCKAGFLNIFQTETTPENFIQGTYGFCDNVQFLREFEDGSESLWMNVLTTKGGKFHSIDLTFLMNLKVSNMHNAWKKMVDYKLWKRMNSSSHASFAYKMN